MRPLALGMRAAAIAAAMFSFAGQASAYCRTTTCDPAVSCRDNPEDCCILNSNGCETNGVPIAWPTSCVSYNYHEAGSAKRGISGEQLGATLDDAYDAWMSSSCSDGALSLAVENRGSSSCGASEFNEGPKDRNANVWMFRDDEELSNAEASDEKEIGLDASTLAVAVVRFNPATAEIYDVDVELNSARAPYTVTEDAQGAQVDLLSVVTHEAGHFLGLDHSYVPGATMGSGYTPGTIDARSLSPDDEAGICAVYPEDREISSEDQTCEPRGKYSPKCEGAGCDCGLARSTRGNAPTRAVWLGLAALGALLVRRRARS